MKKRGVIFIIIGVLLILTPLYFILRPTQCETAGCFETAADSCDSATYVFKENDEITESVYKIKGGKDEFCELEVEVKSVSERFSESTKRQFENKAMTCFIPKEEFSRMTFEEMGANLDLCQGPLKEAMYEAVVKKLYNLVVKDMSTVLEEVERNL